MDNSSHQFHELFEQLGLAADAASISHFIASHAPLAGHIALPDAPFWSPAQASFLREALLQDSNWAELADQLSQALRSG